MCAMLCTLVQSKSQMSVRLTKSTFAKTRIPPLRVLFVSDSSSSLFINYNWIELVRLWLKLQLVGSVTIVYKSKYHSEAWTAESSPSSRTDREQEVHSIRKLKFLISLKEAWKSFPIESLCNRP